LTIKEQINKGVTRNDFLIQPSEDFLKALEVVEKLGGASKLLDRNEIID
jgi:hypothetical protein